MESRRGRRLVLKSELWLVPPPRWKTKFTFLCMLFVRVGLACLWKGSTAKVKSRWLLKISAVAAHHGLTPAFQTIFLTGHALEAYWRAPDTQVVARSRASRVSRNAPSLPSTQAHALSLRGKFSTPFFLLWCVWFDLEPIWEQKNRKISDQNPHFFTHATFLAGKWHKSSPPPTPVTPNSLIFMHKCYIYV